MRVTKRFQWTVSYAPATRWRLTSVKTPVKLYLQDCIIRSGNNAQKWTVCSTVLIAPTLAEIARLASAWSNETWGDRIYLGLSDLERNQMSDGPRLHAFNNYRPLLKCKSRILKSTITASFTDAPNSRSPSNDFRPHVALTLAKVRVL
jgi:hypothetical protein